MYEYTCAYVLVIKKKLLRESVLIIYMKVQKVKHQLAFCKHKWEVDSLKYACRTAMIDRSVRQHMMTNYLWVQPI